MSILTSLVVKLVGDISEFTKDMDNAAAKLSDTGKSMTQVGQGMTRNITLPLIGAAGASLYFSTKFNEGMANVASLGQEAQDSVANWKPLVQDMAISVGKSTDDMTEGLYNVVSAFGVADDTLEVLDINARAATAGLSTVTEAINLTSAVTKAYGDTSAEAVQKVSDLALTAVQLGQTTFPELAASVGLVTPLMNELGGSQEELFAVMATATGVTGGASQVATQLRGVLQSLMAPTGAMADLMSDLGFESGQAMIENLGLHGVMTEIVKAAEATGQPLQKYIGSIEGQTLALALTGAQADTYAEKLEAMSSAAGATDMAFAAQTDGINKAGFAMQQARVQAAVWAQQIGDELIPVVLGLMEMATPLVAKITDWIRRFGELDEGTKKIVLVMVGLLAAAGPVLVIVGHLVTAIGAIMGVASAVVPALSAVAAVLTGPVGLAILAVVALAALLYAAWTNNWGGIQEKTQAVITFIQGIIQSGLEAIKAFWQQHGDAIMSAVRAAWEFIYSIVEVYIGYVQGIIKAVSYAIEGDWYMFGVTIRETILEAWTRIREIFSQAGERILEIVANLIISIKNWFINTDWRELGSAIINGIVTGLQNGAAAVAQAAGNAARAALDAAKGLLGIQSPSKAFMEVGRDVTRGMAKGIADGTARVETAIDHMVHLPEVAGRGGGNQITVNVDARGGEIGIEERIRRGVADALREVGFSADARIRVGYGTA